MSGEGGTSSDVSDVANVADEANRAKSEGNSLYGDGKYGEALDCYERGLEIAGEEADLRELRAMCHCNRAICFIQLGEFKKSVTESSRALDLNPSYVKAVVRRAQAYEKLESYDEAIGDLKKITELDPSNRQAVESIRRLTPLAEEKREKLKEEMLGKLKELGNSLLGRFGMSLDSFKTVKDPVTGSYSINLQK